MNSTGSSDNPYRPPETTNLVPAASVPMEFAGEITLADYRRMLPTTMDIIWYRVLLGLVLVVALPMLVALALVIFRKIPGAELAVMVASLLVSLAIGGAIYLVSPTARANRYLRGKPDLLGPARGTLSERGLYFDDGNCKHWFSWSSLHAVRSRADGLRISFTTIPTHFLALSSRVFLPYNRKHADRMIAEFGHRSRTTDELLTDSCEAFDKSVTDTGYFCGMVSISQSCKSAELWTSVISELTTGIGLILFAIFSVGYWRLIGILGIYCLIGFAQRYRLYMYGSQEANHLAWGWIDSSGLIFAVDSQATWRPISAFNKIVSRERYVELQLVGGECLYVYFEHMKNPTEFMSIANTWTFDFMAKP